MQRVEHPVGHSEESSSHCELQPQWGGPNSVYTILSILTNLACGQLSYSRFAAKAFQINVLGLALFQGLSALKYKKISLNALIDTLSQGLSAFRTEKIKSLALNVATVATLFMPHGRKISTLCLILSEINNSFSNMKKVDFHETKRVEEMRITRNLNPVYYITTTTTTPGLPTVVLGERIAQAPSDDTSRALVEQ